MHYYADASLGLDVIKKSLAAEDPAFKIDGGEVSRGGEVLAEIELTKPGSDMFADDIAGMMNKLRYAGPNAQQLMQRIQGTQTVLAINMISANAMDQLGPFWNVLARLATGLWHVEGQGLYDQGQLLASV
jgi:hypothetical protein